jgi:hypothetical protein
MKTFQLVDSDFDGKEIDFDKAFTLEAYDSTGQGESRKITLTELMNSQVGSRWWVVSGNSHRTCVVEDSLEIIYINDTGILLNGESLYCGDYPNFEYTKRSRLVWVNY